jgi:hypothetical protein
MGGARPTRIEFDELGSDADRRELLVVREDGSTYSADIPADMDLGEVLHTGEVVGFDAGTRPLTAS